MKVLNILLVKVKRVIRAEFVNFWRNGWLSLATILVMVITLFVAFNVHANEFFLNEPPFDSPSIVSSNPGPTPSILTITSITQNSVTLSWTKNPDPDFFFYDLYRIISLAPLNVIRIARIYDRNQTSFIDSLPYGTTYYYTLRTYNQAGLFSRSNSLGALYVPSANITVDGSISDWSGLTPSIQDYLNDQIGNISGTDISNVYLVHDEEYFYARMDLNDGSPNAQNEVYYSISFDSQQEGPIVGDKYLRSQFFPGLEQNQSVLRQRTLINPPQAITIATDIAAVGSNTLEMRTPLNKLDGGLLYFYVNASTVPGPIGYYDGTIQMVIKIPILPVPLYYQNDPLWADETYDYTTSTIKSLGCALTSLVMLLNYYSANTTPDTFEPTNPYFLNKWLKKTNGYETSTKELGNVNWEAIDTYSDKVSYFKLAELTSLQTFDCTRGNLDWCKTALDNDLAASRPVIIYTKNSIKGTYHFVIATGKTDGSWYINDPFKLLPPLATPTKLSDDPYRNQILGLRRFIPEATLNPSFLHFNLASPADLLVIDSQGRKTGFDPITQTYYYEIPNAVYYTERLDNDETGELGIPVKILHISQPVNGAFTLQVIGTDLGSYDFSINSRDTNGSSTVNILPSGITQSNLISNYSINYTSAPGKPTEIERIVTIQDAIEDVKISYELGWIIKKFVRDTLITKLQVAHKLEEQKEKQLRHFDKLIEKAKAKYEEAINKAVTAVLKTFIKEVELYAKKGWIKEQAKTLLIDDATYIISHL